jgi:hypothetical protein
MAASDDRTLDEVRQRRRLGIPRGGFFGVVFGVVFGFSVIGDGPSSSLGTSGASMSITSGKPNWSVMPGPATEGLPKMGGFSAGWEAGPLFGEQPASTTTPAVTHSHLFLMSGIIADGRAPGKWPLANLG